MDTIHSKAVEVKSIQMSFVHQEFSADLDDIRIKWEMFEQKEFIEAVVRFRHIPRIFSIKMNGITEYSDYSKNVLKAFMAFRNGDFTVFGKNFDQCLSSNISSPNSQLYITSICYNDLDLAEMPCLEYLR